jgi:hypothetical protein
VIVVAQHQEHPQRRPQAAEQLPDGVHLLGAVVLAGVIACSSDEFQPCIEVENRPLFFI